MIILSKIFHSAQTNTLRRASSTMICAFLCLSTGSEFVTIRTEPDGLTGYSLQRIDLIPAPEFDLVEFDVNENRIWGLWCNSQGMTIIDVNVCENDCNEIHDFFYSPSGDFNVSSFSLKPNNGSDWVSAGLEILPERFVKVEEGIDPRQAFCSYIFYPGRFQRDVIDKALIVSFMFST